MLKKIFFLMLILFSMEVFAQDDLFFYIPSDTEINDFIIMKSYLKDWNDNKIKVDDEKFVSLMDGLIGKDTLQSLQFEAFLRYTKNKNIQKRILKYINDNKLNSVFTTSLRKLYAAKEVKYKFGEKDVIQYNYKDQEYDENINLFLSKEVNFFNNELGLLVFDNNWDVLIAYRHRQDETDNTLLCGGGTNSMAIAFKKYPDVKEKDIKSNSKFKTESIEAKYKNSYVKKELQLEGVLQKSGADKIIIMYGTGSDMLDTVSGTFAAYFYNKSKKTLYEVTYFMSFSSINIHYSERNRMYNLLLFQLLFINLL